MIDYQQEETRVLRAGFRGKRLRLLDDDRRRLVVKAQALGREALVQMVSVATLATGLRGNRQRLITEAQNIDNEARLAGAGLSHKETPLEIWSLEKP